MLTAFHCLPTASTPQHNYRHFITFITILIIAAAAADDDDDDDGEP